MEIPIATAAIHLIQVEIPEVVIQAEAEVAVPAAIAEEAEEAEVVVLAEEVEADVNNNLQQNKLYLLNMIID